MEDRSLTRALLRQPVSRALAEKQTTKLPGPWSVVVQVKKALAAVGGCTNSLALNESLLNPASLAPSEAKRDNPSARFQHVRITRGGRSQSVVGESPICPLQLAQPQTSRTVRSSVSSRMPRGLRLCELRVIRPWLLALTIDLAYDFHSDLHMTIDLGDSPTKPRTASRLARPAKSCSTYACVYIISMYIHTCMNVYIYIYIHIFIYIYL